MVLVFIAGLVQAIILIAVTFLLYSVQHLLIANGFSILKDFNTTALMVVIAALELLALLYVFTLFIFYSPLIALENKGIVSALVKSVRLGWNHGWRIFSLQLTPWVVFVVATVFIRHFTGMMPQPFWVTGVHLLVFALYIPWVSAMIVVQLQDLELRR